MPWRRRSPAQWGRVTLSFIVLRYIPWFTTLNLLREIAQLPLCTLWTDSNPSQIAYAVWH